MAEKPHKHKLKLKGSIGKGAFGEIYKGGARTLHCTAPCGPRARVLPLAWRGLKDCILRCRNTGW